VEDRVTKDTVLQLLLLCRKHNKMTMNKKKF
jgi:hypothetical protein